MKLANKPDDEKAKVTFMSVIYENQVKNYVYVNTYTSDKLILGLCQICQHNY